MKTSSYCDDMIISNLSKAALVQLVVQIALYLFCLGSNPRSGTLKKELRFLFFIVLSVKII